MMRFLFIILNIISFGAYAQQGYKEGDVVKDFTIKKILNHPASSASFSSFKNKLTIIDFFGTWCVPCIKALPHLKELQDKYKSELSILLVSNEEESKLSKFITAKKNFTFPLAVDEGEVFTNLFQPPSYPHSVILNGEGKILYITNDAGTINEAAITTWLNNKPGMPDTPIENTEPLIQNTATPTGRQKSNNPTVQLSQDFMYAAKTGEAVTNYEEQLKNMRYEDLKTALKNDDDKKAFWINLYNAYTQVALKKDQDQYKKRRSFFRGKKFVIAGKDYSLDNMEHGILRRSKLVWSLGHFSKLFPKKTEKELRVDAVDYRIHFALNCGAKSCPPIAYYAPEKLDQQLELATKNYLKSESSYNAENNEAQLPAIMGWFRADFGGKKGMRKILKKHQLIPEDANPKIKFKKYNWDLYLDNYKTEIE